MDVTVKGSSGSLSGPLNKEAASCSESLLVSKKNYIASYSGGLWSHSFKPNSGNACHHTVTVFYCPICSLKAKRLIHIQNSNTSWYLTLGRSLVSYCERTDLIVCERKSVMVSKQTSIKKNHGGHKLNEVLYANEISLSLTYALGTIPVTINVCGLGLRTLTIVKRKKKFIYC
jgi:hypothetical protein